MILPSIPTKPIEKLMNLDMIEVSDLYSIVDTEKTTKEKAKKTTATATVTATNNDNNNSNHNTTTTDAKALPIDGKKVRHMDFHYVDSGIAYNEKEKTSRSVNQLIKLDQCARNCNIEWFGTPLMNDGINFVGKYIVKWLNENGQTYIILVPGIRSYDPAGIKYDLHASIRVGGACAASITHTFISMIVALKNGALLKDIVTLQIEQLNPIVRRYHGNVYLIKNQNNPYHMLPFYKGLLKLIKIQQLQGNFYQNAFNLIQKQIHI
jgi:hypothetical protein